MKYFPPKLWLDFSSRRKQTARAAKRTWTSNFRSYKKSLQRILPALSPKARRFFLDALLLHDGTLNRMEIGDQIDRFAAPRRRSDWDRRNVRVRLFVLPRTGEFGYELEYKLVSNVQFNFPGRLSLFPAGLYPNFGDWGYDELSLVSKALFRHEILFSSGASISIDFQKFSVRRRSLKQPTISKTSP
jgi:hypothetical protein